jgi:hypothetical protein
VDKSGVLDSLSAILESALEPASFPENAISRQPVDQNSIISYLQGFSC